MYAGRCYNASAYVEPERIIDADCLPRKLLVSANVTD